MTTRQAPSPKTARLKARKENTSHVSTLRSVTSALTSTPGVKVDKLRMSMGVSQVELARVTGYSIRSIAGWEAGKVVSESARQKIAETNRLREALAAIVGSEEKLGEWLRTPNPAFEGQTPIQVIERGESDRLWRMIFQIDANVAN